MNRRAFTLLELLVAIAIVGIIAVSLFASLGIAFRAKRSAEEAVEPARTAELTFSYIRNALANAVPPRGILAGAFIGTDGTDDRGNDGDDVVFYTTSFSPDHPEGANGEIKRVELHIVVQNGFTDHVLARDVSNNLLAQVAENPDEEVVCRGIWGFNVRYFDGTTWQDNWDSTASNNTLPYAVEVTLSLDRPTPDGQDQILTFQRVFQIPCSIASTLDDGTDGSGTVSQNSSAVSSQTSQTGTGTSGTQTGTGAPGGMGGTGGSTGGRTGQTTGGR